METSRKFPLHLFQKAVQKVAEDQTVSPQPTITPPPSQPPTETQPIEDAIKERERIKNRALELDIQHKKMTLRMLFVFLAMETFGIFLFAFFQATHQWGFALEEWSFKLLTTVTILQITYMLQVAVKHLFPVAEK